MHLSPICPTNYQLPVQLTLCIQSQDKYLIKGYKTPKCIAKLHEDCITYKNH